MDEELGPVTHNELLQKKLEEKAKAASLGTLIDLRERKLAAPLPLTAIPYETARQMDQLDQRHRAKVRRRLALDVFRVLNESPLDLLGDEETFVREVSALCIKALQD